MEGINSIVAIIFFITFVIAGGGQIARIFLIGKKKKEYVEGLRTNLGSLEELMQLIRSMNCFCVKQVYYNEQGNVEIQGKAGKHKLRLENGMIYAEEKALANTRKDYNFIVEENAILDFIAKEENHALPINPFAKYKNSMLLKKIHIASIIVTYVSLALLIALQLIPSGNDYINMVKDGSPQAYPTITYEKAFENYFSNPDWKYFKSDAGKKVVEFNGNCMYYDEEADICFQFVIDEEDETFTAEYLGINGEAQNMLVLAGVLEAVFENYEEQSGSSIAGGNNSIEALTAQEEATEQDETESQETKVEGTDVSDEPDGSDGGAVSENDTAQTTDSHEYDNVDVNNLNYRELYESFVMEMNAMYEGNCTYSLYDINADGRKELLLSYGATVADYVNIVYTVDEKGAVSSTNVFGGVYTFYEAEDGNGLYAVNGYMGIETVRRVTLQNNQIVEELLWEKEIGPGDYYSNDKPLVYAESNDLSLLGVEQDTAVPSDMILAESPIDYLELSGRYNGINQASEISLSMYSSPEEYAVGNVEISFGSGEYDYSGKISEAATNVYKVEEVADEVLLGISTNEDGTIFLQLYVNGQLVEEFLMQEHFVS